MRRGAFALMAAALMLATLLPAGVGEVGAPSREDLLHPVFGFVTDESGSPIVGAKVQVRDLDNGFVGNWTTDMGGYFQVEIAPFTPGDDFTVKATYRQWTATVADVIPDTLGASRVDVELQAVIKPVFGIVRNPDATPRPGMAVECVHLAQSRVVVSDYAGRYWFDLAPAWVPADVIGLSTSGSGLACSVSVNPVSLPLNQTLQLVDVEPPAVSASAPSSVAWDDSLEVEATATDNWAVASCTLHYRMESEAAYRTAAMSLSGGKWLGSSALLDETGAGLWYVTASDGPNSARFPATGAVPFAVSDVNAPVIVHSPLASVPSHLPATLACTATDDQGVTEVVLHVRPVGGAWSEYSLTGGPSYSMTLAPQNALGFVGYYFTASDGTNAARAPASGNHSFRSVDTVPPSGSCQFPSEASADRATPVAVVAYDAVGLRNGTLRFLPPGATSWQSVPLAPATGGFSGQAPVLNATGTLRMSVLVYDTSGNRLCLPGPDADDYASVPVVDSRAPTLKHASPAQAPPFATLNLTARAYDDVGVTACRLFYRFSSTSVFTVRTCLPRAGGYYALLALPSSGVLQYYFRATDGANWASLPATAPTGYFELPIVDAAGPSLSWSVPTSVEAGQGFSFPVTADDPSGVVSVTVSSSGVVSGAIPVEWLGGSNFTASVPGAHAIGTFSLSATATDWHGNPSSIGPKVVQVFDTRPPEMSHEERYYAYVGTDAIFSVTIDEATALQAAWVDLSFPNGTSSSVALSEDDGATADWDGDSAPTPGLYGVLAPVGSVTGPLNYSFAALDGTNPLARLPDGTGSFTLGVIGIDTPLVTDATVSAVDVGAGVWIRADIVDNGTIAWATAVVSGPEPFNGTFNMTLVAGTPQDGEWAAYLGAASAPMALAYRIEASDGFNLVRLPFGSAVKAIAVADLSPPSLSASIANATASTPIEFSLDASDNYGIASAGVEWLIGYGAAATTGAALVGGNATDGSYRAYVPAPLRIGWLRHRAFAVDLSGKRTYSPAAGWASAYLSDASPPKVQFDANRTASASRPLLFEASVVDDLGVTSVLLRFDGAAYQMEEVERVELPDRVESLFTVTVPATMAEGDFYAFVEASDANSTRYSAVSLVQAVDDRAPSIAGVNATRILAGRWNNVSVSASDDLGVESANLTLLLPEPMNIAASAIGNGTARFAIPPVAMTGEVACTVAVSDARNEATLSFTLLLSDIDPPSVELHAPGSVEAGQAAPVTATVSDAVAVVSVVLLYRLPGSATFATTVMAAGANGSYSATVPAVARTGGLDLRAMSSDGFNVAESQDVSVPVSDTVPPAVEARVFSAGWGAPWRVCVQASDVMPVTATEMAVEWPDGSSASFAAYANSTGPGLVFEAVGTPLPGLCSYSLSVSDGTHAVAVAGNVSVPDVVAPVLTRFLPSDEERSASLPIQFRVRAVEDHRLVAMRLLYRFGSANWTAVEMPLPAPWTPDGADLEASIPALRSVGTLEYRFEATDGAHEVALPASGAMSLRLVDATPPACAHVQPARAVYRDESLALVLSASDDIGVRNATLRYTLPDGTVGSVEGEYAGDGAYLFTLPASEELGQATYFFVVDDGVNTVTLLREDGDPWRVEVERDPAYAMWVAAGLSLLLLAVGLYGILRKR